MADSDKGVLQTILENLRDAGIAFAKPYQTPANIPSELKKLLGELGIADAQNAVSSRLATVANSWGDIGDLLQNTQFNFLNPAQAIAELGQKGKAITDNINKIVNVPAAVLADLGAIGAAITNVLPKRLLDYILYEFVTKSHPKIGGIFLLLAIIRREPHPGGPGLIPANIRIFDFAQLIAVITDPKSAFKKALQWGTDAFNARPLVDGMVLLGDLIQPGDQAGLEDDTYPLTEEDDFVSVTPGVAPSARRKLTTPAGVVSFVGLHRHGIGVFVPNPVTLSGGVGSLNVGLPSGVILALTPDGSPEADPRVTVFP
jgi:hypothetical protein